MNSIKIQTANAEANAEKLVHMKKIKSDIDLIKYTLNSQSTSTAVARGGVGGGRGPRICRSRNKSGPNELRCTGAGGCYLATDSRQLLQAP